MSAKRTPRLKNFVAAIRPLGYTKRQATRIAEGVIKIWKDALIRGETVQLPIGDLKQYPMGGVKTKILYVPPHNKYIVLRRRDSKTLAIYKNRSIPDCLN